MLAQVPKQLRLIAASQVKTISLIVFTYRNARIKNDLRRQNGRVLFFNIVVILRNRKKEFTSLRSHINLCY